MAAADRGRDYSLVGEDTRRAETRGLAKARWYRSDVPREELKRLMQREDGPAIRDTLLWIAGFAVSGTGAVLTWGTWWCVPFLLVYGVLYGSSSDSRWHECGHRTAFRTQWMNDAVYHAACFMILREPELWRWSHARHHMDTLIVGRDPEIGAQRPISLLKTAMKFLGLLQAKAHFVKLFTHAAGRMLPDEATYVPERCWPRIHRTARVYLAIHTATLVAAVASGSLLPLMLGGLASLHGAWFHVLTGLTQHAGLAEDVLDHRLNCRTVHMGPIARFLYWNMNYHVEHHMFPMVPYHRLPELHALLKDDMPRPYAGFVDAYREIIPALLRQRRDPDHFVERRLPATARPFTPGAAVHVALVDDGASDAFSRP
ncbi:MAG: fatty acid desaturase family protein [Alphaproteobacteria bacterium]|nr:fatty acid desaturase family protein [Alphaproteobacteria bacterium]